MENVVPSFLGETAISRPTKYFKFYEKSIKKASLRLIRAFPKTLWVSFESLSLIETHLKKSINIQSFKTNILTHPFAFPIDFYVYFAKQHIVCKTNETFILMVIMGPALCCLKRNMALLKVLGHQLMLLRCDHHQAEAFFNLHHDKF